MSHTWAGRPVAKPHTYQGESPTEPQNPAVRGAVLYYFTKLLVASPFAQNLLYTNAGFSKALRNHPALIGAVPRWDPTVIRTDGRPHPVFRDVLNDLLKEDFRSRAPRPKKFASTLDYHHAYLSGQVSPSDVVEALLPLIRRDIQDASNHSVAFLETRVDLVRRAAAASTERYKQGKPLSPLDGVPIAVKDEVDLTGYTRCLGSKMDYTSKDDATTQCIEPWLEAGAVIVGKTNMHELGMDVTNINPTHGTPLNPYNNSYYTGGSSGGSSYVLASGLVPIAHGADAGGSIRIPSSFCGVYGLKPSHNRISGRPTPPLASNVGVHGPMAANMVDLEIAYRLMARPDVQDPNAASFIAPVSTTLLEHRQRPLGIDRAWFDRADPLVREACQRAIDWLVINLDYKVVEITLPLLHEAQSAHAISTMSEMAAGLPDTTLLTAPNQILATSIGGQATGVDLLQAQKVRNVLMEHLSYLYSRFPGMIIVSPTTPNAGWKMVPGDLTYGTSNGNMTIQTMTYIFLANFTGTPAISVPVGYAEQQGGALPIGLMGMGEWCSEDELLTFGYDCERYLHKGVEGGRRQPPNWVDVLSRAREEQ